jgi:hypothetical protein
MIDRAIAVAGVLCMAAALVTLWVARLSVPYDVYVSELGATGMPTARVFQIVLLLIVAGGALIAVAGRGIRSRARILRWWPPSISLGVASVFFLVDSQVTCTAGCPLPVGATFTLQDFVHTLAAVLAFAAASWTILQCAFAVGHPALARFSLVAAIAVAAISTAGGLMSLFHFQAVLGSRFELVATTTGLAWVVVFGASLVAARQRGSAPHGIQKLVGQADQPMDLVVVPLDPPALGLRADRHEGVVLLPDDERAVGA